eukprot:gene2194-2336_t
MPVTRKQAILTEFILPQKYDTSLFQKRGDCIEGLPIPVFLMIRSFLSEKDYRALMNGNLATFQPIKYETVQYTLVGAERWDKIESSIAPEKREKFFNTIIHHNVKDRSKQISLNLTGGMTFIDLKKRTHLFEGIQKLIVDQGGKDYPPTFDCSVFNNIPHVVLKSLQGVRKIMNGFENVLKLEIIDCHNLKEIFKINEKTESLREIRILGCAISSLQCSIKHIPNVTLDSKWLFSISSFGDHERLSINSEQELSISTLENLKNHLTKLDYLKLKCSFPVAFNHSFHIFQNIPHLDIHYDVFRLTRPEFPLFNGKTLSVKMMNLSLWNASPKLNVNILKNLSKLDLAYCNSLIHFPILPGLVELSMELCSVETIPRLKSLKVLEIRNCPKLAFISPVLPCLKEAVLIKCDMIEDLSFAAQSETLQSLRIIYCKRISDVSRLKAIPKLELREE